MIQTIIYRIAQIYAHVQSLQRNNWIMHITLDNKFSLGHSFLIVYVVYGMNKLICYLVCLQSYWYYIRQPKPYPCASYKLYLPSITQQHHILKTCSHHWSTTQLENPFSSAGCFSLYADGLKVWPDFGDRKNVTHKPHSPAWATFNIYIQYLQLKITYIQSLLMQMSLLLIMNNSVKWLRVENCYHISLCKRFEDLLKEVNRLKQCEWQFKYSNKVLEWEVCVKCLAYPCRQQACSVCLN